MGVKQISYTGTVNQPMAVTVNRPEDEPKASAVVSDSISLSQEALAIEQHVKAVKNTPEVRPEVIQPLKAAVVSGHYPPPSIIDGLSKMIGNSVAQVSS